MGVIPGRFGRVSVGDASAANDPAMDPIRIWLDSYDDLFSDFDPRPFAKRALSDDFLSQAKKVSREQKGGQPFLMLLMPEGSRDTGSEGEIVKRLHDHFRTACIRMLDERKRKRRRGLMLAAAGLVLMVAASTISFRDQASWTGHLLLVVLEPAGWFLLWTGLDALTSRDVRTKSELTFLTRMAHARIEFGNY